VQAWQGTYACAREVPSNTAVPKATFGNAVPGNAAGEAAGGVGGGATAQVAGAAPGAAPPPLPSSLVQPTRAAVLCALLFGLLPVIKEPVLPALCDPARAPGIAARAAGPSPAPGAVAAVWWLEPLLGLGLFIGSSAYHFGQAEVSDHQKNTALSLWIRRFCWGIALLTIPLIVHGEALQVALQEWEINTTPQILQLSGLASLLLAVGGYLLASWMAMGSKTINSAALLPVASWMGYAVLLCVTPPLWGFTLYFGIWHAWPALEHVAKALKLSQANDWLKALLPNYLPSLLATLAWIWLASWWAPEYLVAGLLVLLSALTVPHTFVFERLYRKA
jgi:Brp/Blh family beta-carotene 15,15'-monooxygenase